jgi:S-DNA-T family DNA segregation ATPase FtsK/SpoIIIE
MAKSKTPEAPSGLQILLGTLLLPIALFILLGLASYDWHDIPFLYQQSPVDQAARNWVGPVGAWLSCILFMGAGIGAYGVPVWCVAAGLLMIFYRGRLWPKLLWIALSLIGFSAVLDLHGAFNIKETLNITDNGGIFGWLITQGLLIRWLSSLGAGIIIWSFFLFALVMAIGVPTLLRGYHYALAACGLMSEQLAQRRTASYDRRQLIEKEERKLEKQRRRLEKSMQKRERKEEIQRRAEAIAAEETESAAEAPAPIRKPNKRTKPEKAEEKPQPKPEPLPAPVIDPDHAQFPGYKLPSMSLLDELPASHGKAGKGDFASTAQLLVDTLNEFGISTEVSNVKQGPVVTRYELLPAKGIRVERIAGLANNLALALKATSLRVQAPVPGKGVVGIEVPNEVANMVVVREILESREWRSGSARLPMALGKDVGGRDIVADLAKMPHILIAGATGSGKSVCINSILAGLLMSKTPDELRMILVDPKIVEFAVYNNLPHLVVPVITDPNKVALSLRWAITEMEKRYKLFAKAKVRNIESFNNRQVAQQGELFDGEGDTKPGDGLPSSVPYIVIVIDELADLMLAAGAEIENSIARLAQLSRAVGIHMIIATQRPSVNVITGTIKANFPARIAFQVAQKVDSRTILDQSGADQLLGRGDMLYLPPSSSKLVRSQGAMVTDDEIHRIADYIKGQAEPSFEMEIKTKLDTPSSSPDALDDGADDELLTQAVEIIRETHRASTSSLQRRLRIGYTRAARLVDILEERGIVGPPNGSGPREILIDLDGDIPNNADDSVDTDDDDEEEVIERVV